MNKTTSQSLKKFLSTAVDMFRPAYARNASEFRRHCIILGTTNELANLRDLTGNRRIWPVTVGTIDLERFSADVDQLWAEAVVREAAGESITLSPRLWAAASKVQGRRMVEDAYEDVLDDNFGETKGRVSMDSVKLLLGLDTARMSPMDTRRIKAVSSRFLRRAASSALAQPPSGRISRSNGSTSGPRPKSRPLFVSCPMRAG